VVDDAHILSPATKANLETKLADLEGKSTIQLVVATVPDLGGDEIEPYANALFRAWRLGQADKNNGVLFLIAPNQHRMRIEVGYGLEGTLTDATTSIILANAAAPRFKTGDYDGGVTRAVDDIITALTTDSSDWRTGSDFKPAVATQAKDSDAIFPFLIFLFIFLIIWTLSRKGRRTGGAWIATGGGWSSGGGGSPGGDSGFSGGGGSSGGGGASGSW
jgi:uncharacterized protein